MDNNRIGNENTRRIAFSTLALSLLTASLPALAGPNEDLLAAALKSDVAAARAALQQGAQPDARDPAGNTPLIFAAKTGDVGMGELLLYYGADVDLKNNDGDTANRVAKSESQKGFRRLLKEEQRPPFASHAVLLDLARTPPAPDLFKRAASYAFEVRHWTVESAGAGVVTGVMKEPDGRTYRAEIRLIGSRVYISFLRGYQRELNNWLFNLAQEMQVIMNSR